MCHAITTGHQGVLWWYEASGCVAFDGALYLVGDQFNHSREFLTRAVTGRATDVEAITLMTVTDFLTWPPPCFCIMFSFELGGRRFQCFFMRDRAAFLTPLICFVDRVNPAFKRLQRWLRVTGRRRRKAREAQRLSFAMCLHPRLGAASVAAALTEDALRLVLR